MLGDLDIKDFLSHYIQEKHGDVLNEEGEIIGHHEGAVFLTLGERHGFTITKKTPTDEPYYIVKKDIEKNTIVVNHARTAPGAGSQREVRLERCNWVCQDPAVGDKYVAQIRYHGEYLPCEIASLSDGCARIEFDDPVLAAAGQSVVLYEGDVCIGGGIIAG